MDTLNFKLTNTQRTALEQLQEFVKGKDRAFVLRGYAGTGKTTLMKVFIDYLNKEKLQYRLLASTGRAAKILSDIVKSSASTIHSEIYTYNGFNQDIDNIKEGDNSGQLYLEFSLRSPIQKFDDSSTIYIIDESSMISDVLDKNITQATFGSGHLLSDLFTYDKHGKFVFVGDICQLPPINQTFSPALSGDYLMKKYHFSRVQTVELTDIMRQKDGNDVILAAHQMRLKYFNPPSVKWDKLGLRKYKNVIIYPNEISLLKTYVEKIANNQFEAATMIASSNSKCNEISSLVRNLLNIKGVLRVGDLLLITQNNGPTGLMNGDLVIVKQISNDSKRRANLNFVPVELERLTDSKKYNTLLIEDIVYSNKTNLSSDQQRLLFIDFFIRMKDRSIKSDSEEFKKGLLEDPYLNAVRAAYGYALTCHKSQGGEWDDVFLLPPRNITLDADPANYQWLYTAITRAKVNLHIVDDFFI